MGFFKNKKQLFSGEEISSMVAAIKSAEMQTSGELRVFIESCCKYVDAIDRAKQIFSNLEMQKTEQRNAVLFYMAVKDKQLAIFADEGIHKAVGTEFWRKSVADAISNIAEENVVPGVVKAIEQIGSALKEHFPYDKEVDRNELPDEIVFGN